MLSRGTEDICTNPAHSCDMRMRRCESRRRDLPSRYLTSPPTFSCAAQEALAGRS